MAMGVEDRAGLEGLLRDLVRIESVSGAEEQAAEFAAAWLSERGLEVEVVERTVIARLVGGDGPRLLLNSHLDTVPAGEGWEQDPWQVDWEEDRLVGLGANDAKGCAAAMMWAAAGLAGRCAEAPLAGELVLALNQQEETNNRGMELVLEHLGGAPDLGVTGEPTGLEVVRARPGWRCSRLAGGVAPATPLTSRASSTRTPSWRRPGSWPRCLPSGPSSQPTRCSG